jgi:hypothetical protein
LRPGATACIPPVLDPVVRYRPEAGIARDAIEVNFGL